MDPRLLSVSRVLVVCAGAGQATVQFALDECFIGFIGADTIGSSSAGAWSHGFSVCADTVGSSIAGACFHGAATIVRVGFRHCGCLQPICMVVHRDRVATSAIDTTA